MDISKAMIGAMGIVGETLPPTDKDVCPVCGKRLRMKMTLPEGFNPREVTVRTACACEQEAFRREKEARESADRRRRLAELKSASMMEARFFESTFDNYEVAPGNEKAFRNAQRYVTDFVAMEREGQGLLFIGQPGTGKTFTAACIANALLKQGIPVIAMSLVRMLDRLSSFDADENAHVLALMNEARLLVLDDLGAERATETALERVYTIIDARYRSKKPMIVTTNISLAEFKACDDMRYERIYQRVTQTCFPVVLTGPCMRNEDARQRYERMSKLFDAPERR